MSRSVLKKGFLLFYLLLLAAKGFSADPKPLETGAQAPDFALPGTDGKTYT